MNKNAYITPEMEIMNVETVDMMATSLIIEEEEVDSKTEQHSHGRRRGSWGDLWYDGE